MNRLLPVLLLIACAEPTDIGERCSQDEGVVRAVLQPSAGENRVALDVSFERCFQFLCVSVNGNDPYCTQRCKRAEDCPAGFTCEYPIEFGPLSRVCDNDASIECPPANYCVRADEWATVGQQQLSADAGP
jgi:hypothetical protein